MHKNQHVLVLYSYTANAVYLSVRNHQQQYVLAAQAQAQAQAQAHQLGSSVMVSQARAAGAVMVPASAVLAPQPALYQQRAQLEVAGAELINFESEPASSALWSTGTVVSHPSGQLVVGPLRAMGSGSLRAVALTTQRPQQQQQQQQQQQMYGRQPQIISSTPVAQMANRYRPNRPGNFLYFIATTTVHVILEIYVTSL